MFLANVLFAQAKCKNCIRWYKQLDIESQSLQDTDQIEIGGKTQKYECYTVRTSRMSIVYGQ